NSLVLTGANDVNDDIKIVGSHAVKVLGLDGADTITGGSGDDTLTGSGGNDVIDGSVGADTIDGDAGDDLLYGDAGNDVIDGGADADTITGGAGDDTIDGGSGSDTVVFGGNQEDFQIGVGANGALSVADVGSGNNLGTDTVIGAEALRFDDGDVNVSNVGGQVLLEDTTPSVYAARFTGSSALNLNLNEAETNVSREITFQTTEGGGLFDVQQGGSHDRHLYITSDGNIKSRVHNTEIIQSSGLNLKDGTIHKLVFTLGGRGTDIYVDGDLVAHGTKTFSNYNWDQYQHIGHSQDGGYFQGDIISYRAWDRELSVSEAKDPSGIAPNHEFVFDANSFPNSVVDTGTSGISQDKISFVGSGPQPTAVAIAGMGGVDNTINVAGSEGVIVAGGFGNDTLSGGSGDDTLYGDAGADRLAGGLGDDTISGGDGDDTVVYGGGADAMDGGAGSDTASFELVASNGIVLEMANNTVDVGSDQSTLLNFEDILGSAQADSITGDAANNVIHGGAGNDTLDGGLGDDALYGGDGDDTIKYSGGTDTIDGDAGSDFVSFENVTSNGIVLDLANDTVTVGSFQSTLLDLENIFGTAQSDDITGDAMNNIIQGGAGDDTITGGAGDDMISGGAGADDLYGGTDSDTFKFSSTSDTGTGDGYRDVIFDFNAGGTGSANSIDLLDLTGMVTADFSFLGTSDFVSGGTSSQGRYNSATKLLEIDADGDAAADAEIELDSHSGVLDQDDFIVS
ncbi:MAG: LamG-like jellyroll fold domain-containing protein, partial [Pseudomonadota bacterium]|nr:LamG-like jellyroll fold domain-containing protein [Pseudomonadota bacterium]